MKNTELQIMVYGKAIGSLRPEMVYDGVEIKKTVSVENPNYLFLYLEIAPNSSPGKFIIDFKNSKGNVRESVSFELLEREDGSAERKGYDNSDVMYLITPDRFANGNLTNDSVASLSEGVDRTNKWGRHGGDIQGIINNLDYFFPIIDLISFSRCTKLSWCTWDFRRRKESISVSSESFFNVPASFSTK